MLNPQPMRAARLGEMPKAHQEQAVLRQVDGCPVSSVVRYNVEGDGRAAK